VAPRGIGSHRRVFLLATQNQTQSSMCSRCRPVNIVEWEGRLVCGRGRLAAALPQTAAVCCKVAPVGSHPRCAHRSFARPSRPVFARAPSRPPLYALTQSFSPVVHSSTRPRRSARWFDHELCAAEQVSARLLQAHQAGAVYQRCSHHRDHLGFALLRSQPQVSRRYRQRCRRAIHGLSY
jgi:hypothetical protein